MTSISSTTNMIGFDNLRQNNQSLYFQSYASHEDMFYSGKRAIYSLWVGSTPWTNKTVLPSSSDCREARGGPTSPAASRRWTVYIEGDKDHHLPV